MNILHYLSNNLYAQKKINSLFNIAIASSNNFFYLQIGAGSLGIRGHPKLKCFININFL